MDKDLKDLLSTTLQHTVTSVGKYQDNKMAENKETKKKRQKAIKWVCIAVGCLLVFVIASNMISSYKMDSAKDKVAECIEKGDFIKARKCANEAYPQDKKDLLFKVVNAQISSLINEGAFDLANEIAKEDGFYITFFNGIIDHLTKIYTQQGANSLLYAMTLVSFPNEKESNLPDFWGAYYQKDEDVKNILVRSNKNIESFCDYLKEIGDNSYIPKMLGYLKPHFVKAETKWDYEKQKDILIKAEYTDYSEVKRIKAKFGY